VQNLAASHQLDDACPKKEESIELTRARVRGSAKGVQATLIALAKIASPANERFDLFPPLPPSQTEKMRDVMPGAHHKAPGNPSARSWEFPMQLLGKLNLKGSSG
jgi:hypothetical protein